MIGQQLDMLAEATRDDELSREWHGAPLTYTTDFHPVADLEAAFDRWVLEHGSFGCLPFSHMWRDFTTGPTFNGHQPVTADALAADKRAPGTRPRTHQPAPRPEGITA